MASLLDWFMQPAAGAQNSALMRTAARPSDVPAYVPPAQTVDTNGGSSGGMSPGLAFGPSDQMTDADRAYYAAAKQADVPLKNAVNQLTSMSPQPGAINQAMARAHPELPAAAFAAPGMLSPYGYGGASAMPQQQPVAQQPAAQPAAAPAATGGGGGGGPQQPPDITIAPATGQPDVTVPDSGQGGTPDQTGQQGDQSGLLNNIIQSASTASQDPQQSKGLLASLGDSLSSIGNKMTNMSPAAAQGFLSAGLTMLANNSGGMNLSQLVGTGGIAGVNTYQEQKQQQIANTLAQQKLAQELWEKQQDIMIKANTPTGVKPGEGYVTPQMLASGQGPQGPSQMPVQSWQETTGPTGIKYKQPVDQFGNATGPRIVSDASIPQPQQVVMNKATSDHNDAVQALNQTQNYIKRLQTTPVPGGWQGDVAKWWSGITGNVSDGQALQTEIQRDLNNTTLQNFKSGIGGRITGGEFNILNQGIPKNADNAGLTRFLQAYGHLQEIKAQRAAITDDFTSANRGVPGALAQDSDVGQFRYKAGTTLPHIIDGTAQPIGPAGGGGAQPAAPAAPAVQAQPQAQPAQPAVQQQPRAPNKYGFNYSQDQVTAELKRRGLI